MAGTLERCSFHRWIPVFTIQGRWQTACMASCGWAVCWCQCCGSSGPWWRWGYGQQTQVHFIDGILNAQRYRDEILRPIVVPFIHDHRLMLQHDNARPNVARICTQFLEAETWGDLSSCMASILTVIQQQHKQIKLGWALLVTYTIIQSIMRSEMCSLHLTHPSVHTWSSGQPTVQRPGSSRGLPVGAGIEHVCDALDRRIRQRVPVPANFQQFRTAIVEECTNIPRSNQHLDMPR